MSYEPPLQVTIPIPSELPRGRGVNATNKRGGNLRIRCTNQEYDEAQKEAEILGISLANFGRWCTIFTAKLLREHREANSTSMHIGEEDNAGTKSGRKTGPSK